MNLGRRTRYVFLVLVVGASIAALVLSATSHRHPASSAGESEDAAVELSHGSDKRPAVSRAPADSLLGAAHPKISPEPSREDAARVVGRCVDSSGAPIASVAIAWASGDLGSEPESHPSDCGPCGETDDDGRFALLVPRATLRSAIRPRLRLSASNRPSVAIPMPSIVAGFKFDVGTVVLGFGVRIRGTLRGPGGAPVGRSLVSWVRHPADWPGPHGSIDETGTVQCDDGGGYQSPPLSPGSVVLNGSSPSLTLWGTTGPLLIDGTRSDVVADISLGAARELRVVVRIVPPSNPDVRPTFVAVDLPSPRSEEALMSKAESEAGVWTVNLPATYDERVRVDAVGYRSIWFIASRGLSEQSVDLVRKPRALVVRVRQGPSDGEAWVGGQFVEGAIPRLTLLSIHNGVIEVDPSLVQTGERLVIVRGDLSQSGSSGRLSADAIAYDAPPIDVELRNLEPVNIRCVGPTGNPADSHCDVRLSVDPRSAGVIASPWGFETAAPAIPSEFEVRLRTHCDDHGVARIVRVPEVRWVAHAVTAEGLRGFGAIPDGASDVEIVVARQAALRVTGVRSNRGAELAVARLESGGVNILGPTSFDRDSVEFGDLDPGLYLVSWRFQLVSMLETIGKGPLRTEPIPSFAIRLALGEGETRSVACPKVANSWIHGAIVLETAPLADARIDVSPAGQEQSELSLLGSALAADGGFRLGPLPAGRYSIRLFGSGEIPLATHAVEVGDEANVTADWRASWARVRIEAATKGAEWGYFLKRRGGQIVASAASTGPDERIEFDVLPGSYVLERVPLRGNTAGAAIDRRELDLAAGIQVITL